MKKSLLVVLLSLSTIFSFSQIKFEPGYFIDNHGNKVNCLIKNTDRITNPDQLEYRLSENDGIKIAGVDSVSEFEISNTIHKYVRAKVPVDRSSDNTRNLGNTFSPLFNDEVLFLRVSLAGNASLYSYYGSNGFKRFFYNVNSASIEPLVYKKYLTKDNRISENVTFRQQLLNMKCGDLTAEDLDRISYKEKDLLSMFVRYNKCVNAEYKNYQSKASKGKYTLAVKGGINTSALEIEQIMNYRYLLSSSGDSESFQRKIYTTNFSQIMSPQVGIELEYIFPSNKQKWSAFFAPAFQYFKDTYEFRSYYQNEPTRSTNPPSQTGDLKVNYSHLMLPVGIKHHFLLNKVSKLTVSGAIAFNLVVAPSKTFGTEDFTVEPKFEQTTLSSIVPFVDIGISYKIKERYAIEASYQFGKTMLDSPEWKVRVNNSFSIMVCYNLW